ncbi:hypothetical protein L484_006399 [Morus notabilis]|uniref:Uncharacterized protein n=1 Tax=Morus notabilis TaxID=981085 RepID=W9QZ65_9ROSA|nr:uncharacterized protein LOC21389830 [Morus notabilis]EXB51826.1 hypothetical protein L484_006399 [Morus notabilis]
MMNFWVKTSSSNPLVSSIVTLYALILLYVPHQFLRVLFSPVLIITGILLFSLLRLGAIQKCEDENRKAEEKSSKETTYSTQQEQEDHNWVDLYESETDSEPETGFETNSRFEYSFVGWNLRAPLEVIYEEEDEDEEEEEGGGGEHRILSGRYASLSRYYPESEEESENSSDGEFPATGFWDSPESLGFRWEEDDREGLIEIALDGNKKNDRNKRGLDFHVEEENLIEIDLSVARNDEFPASNDSPPAS